MKQKQGRKSHMKWVFYVGGNAFFAMVPGQVLLASLDAIKLKPLQRPRKNRSHLYSKAIKRKIPFQQTSSLSPSCTSLSLTQSSFSLNSGCSSKRNSIVDIQRHCSQKEVKKKESKKGFKTINMTEKFSCRAKDLFEILMDENRWKVFSRSNAKISKEVGGQISIFDGSVTGTSLELQNGSLIVQKWRFGSWPNGIDSTVRLTLEEPEPGLTVVKLTHSDIPEEDRYGNATVVENTERGWWDLIFQRIQAVFGFGI